MKKKMLNKKNVLIILLSSTLLIVALFIIRVTSDIYVITTVSSGSFIGSNPTNVHLVNTFFKLKFNAKKELEKVNDKYNIQEENLTKALKTVKKYDNNVFLGEYSNSSEIVFIIKDYIYYYRNEKYNKFYRYNTKTKEIEDINFSSYARDIGNKNIGMHDFTVFNNIKTEALIHLYPELKTQIDKIKGMFYVSDTFYDQGRIFFIKKDILYEYLPKENKTTRIVKFSRATNIHNIYVK